MFSTGDDIASLQGSANLADRFAKDNKGGDNWTYELSLEDGFVAHAPVGSFAPNAFGLHDVHGNVSEWCLDTWEDLDAVTPQAGDGLLSGEQSARSLRGGDYSDGPANARCGYRNGAPPALSAPSWGVRAARDVQP